VFFSGVDDFGALQNFDYVEDLIFFGVLSIPLIAFGCWKIISWRRNPPKTNIENIENEIWQEYRAADYVAMEPETEINYMRQRTQFYDHMDISNFPNDIKYPKELSHEILEKLNGDCSVVSEVHRNIVFMSCLNECAKLEIPLTESGYKYFLFWLKTHDLTSCLGVYPKHFETVMVYIKKYEKTLGYWEKVERVPVDSVKGADRNCYSFEKALDNLQDKNIKNTEIPEISNVISPLAKIMQSTHPTTFNLIIGKPPSVMSREVLIFMYNHSKDFDYSLRYQIFINAVVQLKRKNIPLDRSGYDYLNEWCVIHKKNLREFEEYFDSVFYSKEFIDMLREFLEGLSY